MKKLLALLMIGAFVLSAIPFAASYYPGPGPTPELAMKIDGEWTIDTAPVVFEGIQFCNTFEVEIMIVDAVDLYAYSFLVDWSSADDYIALVDFEVKHIHTDDFVIEANVTDSTYEQAVTAISPALGFNGTAALANLYFHIYNDLQWDDQMEFEITITGKLSDSCGTDLEHSEQSGWIKFTPVQPVLKMLPPVVYKSVVGETFEVQFEIQNIVKMKSFHFTVTWDPDQITTDAQNVWIKDFLPPPYEGTTVVVGEGWLEIGAWMPCEKPPINGTGELFGIRFETLNPWPGEIANYSWVENDHPIWFPDVCWNYINIDGFIDKGCETPHYQWLGDPAGVSVKGPDPEDLDSDPETKFIYDWPCDLGGFIVGYYEFRPVPGDLNLDGHVDIEDLSAIAKEYGWTGAIGDNEFDLDLDGDVDIFDIIIVAKNFCRTEPDPENPWPIFDP